MDGWFSINRQLLESTRWLAEPFTRGQAWVDMVGLAQYQDGHIRVRGIRINLTRGQLGYSIEALAIRWKWSRGKVKRYLQELEKYGDIRWVNNSPTTIVELIKYDYWQRIGRQTDSKRTVNGHQTDTNKKGKKEKKEKNSIYTLDFDEFWRHYPRKIAKRKVFSIWKRRGLSKYLPEMLEFIDKAIKTKQWLDGYIPHPTTFLNGDRWEDDLASYGKKREVVSFK